MSHPNATMKHRFTDNQNKMILDGPLPDLLLAERFGVCARTIRRQRALLKQQAEAQVAHHAP